MIPLDLLDAINIKVNRLVQYKSDHEVHGKDKWQMPAETLLLGTGDCEDYAILKAHMLFKEGCDISDMRIGRFTTRDGKGHAMLLCRSEKPKGFFKWKTWNPVEYVLDNRTNNIYTVDEISDVLTTIVQVSTYVH